MNAKEIYDILRAGGLSRAGALGMLGNMMSESSLISNIAQRGMTSLSDVEYTAAADSRAIDFVHDAVGYGLCQWTYHSRKQALLDYAKEMGTSVGDGVMQCYFCLHELREDFTPVYHTLCTSTSIDECTDLICVRYECPAVNNYAARRNFAHTFEKDIPDEKQSYIPPAKDPVGATFPPDPSIYLLQLIMKQNTFWDGKVDGHYSQAFIDAFFAFGNGMKQIWGGGK